MSDLVRYGGSDEYASNIANRIDNPVFSDDFDLSGLDVVNAELENNWSRPMKHLEPNIYENKQPVGKEWLMDDDQWLAVDMNLNTGIFSTLDEADEFLGISQDW